MAHADKGVIDDRDEMLRANAGSSRVARVLQRWESNGSRILLKVSEDAGQTWSELPLELTWPWRLLGRVIPLEGVWPPECADALEVQEDGEVLLEYRAIVGIDVRDG